MKLVYLVGLCLLFGPAAPAAAAQMIVNPSFENGLNGWTVQGAASVSTAYARTGAYSVTCTDINNPAVLTQSFGLSGDVYTSNRAYHMMPYYPDFPKDKPIRNRVSDPAYGIIEWFRDGQSFTKVSRITGDTYYNYGGGWGGGGGMGTSTFVSTVTVTISMKPGLDTFEYYDGANWVPMSITIPVYVDDVTTDAPGVPEPASFLVLLTGVIPLALRRRVS